MPKITNPYYRYLNRYSPSFLRKHQTGINIDMGRTSHWNTLVIKTGHDSLSYEDDISMRWKEPIYLTNLCQRFMFIASLYCIIFYSLFLGDQMEYFLVDDRDSVHRASSPTDQPWGYESLYAVVRPPHDYVETIE